jgi:hypothetical protein
MVTLGVATGVSCFVVRLHAARTVSISSAQTRRSGN